MEENNIVSGFNRIEELIEKDPGKIQKLIINRRRQLNSRVLNLMERAKMKNINIQRVDERYFKKNRIKKELIWAENSPFTSATDENLKKYIPKQRIIIAIDGINDPHNLGAVIRTAYFMGVKDIVVPKKRVAPLSKIVFSSSAGALSYIRPYRVKNIPGFLRYAKDNGFTIVCADAHGDRDLKEYEPVEKTVILFGSEGSGISSEPRKLCDIRYLINSKTGFESLNLSNSVAIFLYKAVYESNL